MIPIPKTKIQTNESHYIFPLAMRIKEDLENEDIEVAISVLSDSEKELLKSRLLSMKTQVKNPADYAVNLKIYKTIAIIMDKTYINQRKEANKTISFQK